MSPNGRWPDGPTSPHGTWAAYRRCTNGPNNRPCDTCRAAVAASVAQRRRERAAGIPGRAPGIRPRPQVPGADPPRQAPAPTHDYRQET